MRVNFPSLKYLAVITLVRSKTAIKVLRSNKNACSALKRRFSLRVADRWFGAKVYA